MRIYTRIKIVYLLFNPDVKLGIKYKISNNSYMHNKFITKVFEKTKIPIPKGVIALAKITAKDAYMLEMMMLVMIFSFHSLLKITHLLPK